MHTRRGWPPVIRKARALNPKARPLRLRSLRAAERRLAAIARRRRYSRRRIRKRPRRHRAPVSQPGGPPPDIHDCVTSDLKVRPDGTAPVPKLHFIAPDRSGLLPLGRYATVHLGDGTSRLVGYTEASRGCRHLCRHCPIVPVYNGQFRVVQQDVVLADIDAQVAAGARHITFGDPDFFNGPTHAVRIVQALHAAHPGLSYDVTIKVEHLLNHRDLLPVLAGTGCLYITSAVESIDDRVLAILEKGHSRQDFVDAVALCRDAGVMLVPTFVAFHPWMTLADYCDLLQTIAALDLVEHVAPIQLAIRLLVPAGSRLLELPAVRSLVGPFDGNTLTYRWTHPDPRVDALQHDVSAIVGRRLTTDRREAFAAISAWRTSAPDRRASAPRIRHPGRRVSRRPWYLLRRAESGAGDAGLMPRILLLATTTGYQTRAFAEAAESLAVDLVFATDRCHQLDDPGATMPFRFASTMKTDRWPTFWPRRRESA